MLWQSTWPNQCLYQHVWKRLNHILWNLKENCRKFEDERSGKESVSPNLPCSDQSIVHQPVLAKYVLIMCAILNDVRIMANCSTMETGHWQKDSHVKHYSFAVAFIWLQELVQSTPVKIKPFPLKYIMDMVSWSKKAAKIALRLRNMK